MSSDPRSVALLTVEGLASRVLANALSEAGFLNLIVIESASRWSRLQRATKRPLRYLARWGRRLPSMPPERRVEIELLTAAQHRVAEHYPPKYSEWPSGVTRIYVDDLNGKRCQEWLSASSPDVIAVFRTRVLREQIFDLARLGTVNCHYSLLPAYRGNFVEFWQRLNNDLQTTGVTFHFVDQGVDTGDIIASFAHDALPREITPFDLRYRNYMLMLKHFPGVLQAVLEGSCDRKPQPQIASRGYRRRDLTDERRRELYGRLDLLPDAEKEPGQSSRT